MDGPKGTATIGVRLMAFAFGRIADGKAIDRSDHAGDGDPTATTRGGDWQSLGSSWHLMVCIVLGDGARSQRGTTGIDGAAGRPVAETSGVDLATGSAWPRLRQRR